MKKKFLNGSVKRHPDGFGFFIPDEKEFPDVYIPRHSMTGIMTNDKVMIEVEAERGGERFRGEVIKILARGTKHIVGKFSPQNEKYGVLKDEGHGWGQDLRILKDDSMGAKPGELVAAEIIHYPDSKEHFQGKVVEIIGSMAEPMNDIRRVVYAQQIPNEFPPEVQEQASRFSPHPEEKDFAHRVDLRKKNLITIDGKTAKDFDDAVLVEMNAQGFRAYVAIADVSHYVSVNSPIDKEAYERGTSVYFPNFVIPMLPEILSNTLCSLMPRVPRLCLVAEMQFDFTGQKTSSKFYEGVMESKARVTYGEAQEVIDGVEVPSLEHVKDNILRCADLAKILMAKRFKEGSLDLEIPETELEIDASGVPIDVLRSERLFSHKLIEELMLAANVAVAEFLAEREVPCLYRIHEPPMEDAIRVLERYLKSFGSKVSLEERKLQKALTRALEDFEGKPQAQVLHILTLRSMSQAKYSLNNVGHFGLGFENYAHFTSPIRRYPDLIVHRLLKNQVVTHSNYRLMTEDELSQAGTWLSACEQRSVKAERQIQAIKKARFMEKFVGQEFDGMISSVARFGVFVILREYNIDGLIRVEDLSKERLEFDEEQLRLYAKRSGLNFSIGDFLRIKVVAAEHDTGQISFALSKTLEVAKPLKNEKRKKAKEDQRGKERGRNRDQEANRERGGGRDGHRGRDGSRKGNKNRDQDERQGARGRSSDQNVARGRGKDSGSEHRSQRSFRRDRVQELSPKQKRMIDEVLDKIDSDESEKRPNKKTSNVSNRKRILDLLDQKLSVRGDGSRTEPEQSQDVQRNDANRSSKPKRKSRGKPGKLRFKVYSR